MSVTIHELHAIEQSLKKSIHDLVHEFGQADTFTVYSGLNELIRILRIQLSENQTLKGKVTDLTKQLRMMKQQNTILNSGVRVNEREHVREEPTFIRVTPAKMTELVTTETIFKKNTRNTRRELIATATGTGANLQVNVEKKNRPWMTEDFGWAGKDAPSVVNTGIRNNGRDVYNDSSTTIFSTLCNINVPVIEEEKTNVPVIEEEKTNVPVIEEEKTNVSIIEEEKTNVPVIEEETIQEIPVSKQFGTTPKSTRRRKSQSFSIELFLQMDHSTKIMTLETLTLDNLKNIFKHYNISGIALCKIKDDFIKAIVENNFVVNEKKNGRGRPKQIENVLNMIENIPTDNLERRTYLGRFTILNLKKVCSHYKCKGVSKYNTKETLLRYMFENIEF